MGSKNAPSYIYILTRPDEPGNVAILSAHATEKSANDAADAARAQSDDSFLLSVDRIALIGGTVVVSSDSPVPTTTAADRSRSLVAHAKFDNQKDAAPLPTPKAGALAGQTLVFTGELARMTRKRAQDLARAAGARVVTAVSRKCTLVVLGKDAGPKKLEQIEEFGIEIVEEDGFLERVQGVGGGGVKRAADGEAVDGVKEEEDEEDEVRKEEEEVKEEVQASRKRTRRTRA